MSNVLIVDDSSFIRTILKNILVDEGHTIVAEACDGEQAIELYKEHKPDLVTLDILMPVCDGICALQEIMKIDPNAIVVMCTEVGHQATVIKSLQLGAKGFIAKPIKKEVVINSVRCALHDDPHSQMAQHCQTMTEDNLIQLLSFDHILTGDPEQTFSYTLANSSMASAGFYQDDILIVEKDLEPRERDIVLAVANKNFITGYYRIRANGDIAIEPANLSYPVVCGKNIEIFGVVTGSVRKIPRNGDIQV